MSTDLKPDRRHRKLGDLKIVWEVNPRQTEGIDFPEDLIKKDQKGNEIEDRVNLPDEDFVKELAESFKVIADQYDPENPAHGKRPADYYANQWDQSIWITADNIVVRGCHSILAMKQVLGDEATIAVKLFNVEGMDEAKWLSAQSNKHGKIMQNGQKTRSVLFILEQTNLTKENSNPDLKDFIVDNKVAQMVGCSRGLVYQIRGKLLGRPTKSDKDKVEELNEELKQKEEELRQMQEKNQDDYIGLSPDQISDLTNSSDIPPDVKAQMDSDEYVGFDNGDQDVDDADHEPNIPDTDVSKKKKENSRVSPKKEAMSKFKSMVISYADTAFEIARKSEYATCSKVDSILKSSLKSVLDPILEKLDNVKRDSNLDKEATKNAIDAYDLFNAYANYCMDLPDLIQELQDDLDEIEGDE